MSELMPPSVSAVAAPEIGAIRVPTRPLSHPGGLNLADMSAWEEMASAADTRFPKWRTPFTTAHMERWLRKIGVPTRAYTEWDGDRRLTDFITRNPDWTLRAWAGLVLEHRDLMNGGPADAA